MRNKDVSIFNFKKKKRHAWKRWKTRKTWKAWNQDLVITEMSQRGRNFLSNFFALLAAE
jgi:hypothetical protein